MYSRAPSKLKYPNLSVLKPLLTMFTIQNYPKLSLMIYEALKPYIEIFDNQYISFIDLCTKHKLIDFDALILQQQTAENTRKNSEQIH